MTSPQQRSVAPSGDVSSSSPGSGSKAKARLRAATTVAAASVKLSPGAGGGAAKKTAAAGVGVPLPSAVEGAIKTKGGAATPQSDAAVAATGQVAADGQPFAPSRVFQAQPRPTVSVHVVHRSADDDADEMKHFEALQLAQQATLERAHHAESDVRHTKDKLAVAIAELTATKKSLLDAEQRIASMESDNRELTKGFETVSARQVATVRSFREAEDAHAEDAVKHQVEVDALHSDIVFLRKEVQRLSTSALRTLLTNKEKTLMEALERASSCAVSCNSTASCFYCLDICTNPVVLVPCGHVLCEECFRECNKIRGVAVDLAIPLLMANHNNNVAQSHPSHHYVPGRGQPNLSGPVVGLDQSPASATRPIFTAFLDPPPSADTAYLNRKLQDPASRAHLTVDSFAVVALTSNHSPKQIRTVNCYCEECQFFTVTAAVRVTRFVEIVDKVRFVVDTLQDVRHVVGSTPPQLVASVQPTGSMILSAAQRSRSGAEDGSQRSLKISAGGSTRGAFGADLDVDKSAFVFDDE